MERFVCNLPTRNYSGCDLDHIYFKNMNMVAHISSLAVALAAVLFGSHSYRVPKSFRRSAWPVFLYAFLPGFASATLSPTYSFLLLNYFASVLRISTSHKKAHILYFMANIILIFLGLAQLAESDKSSATPGRAGNVSRKTLFVSHLHKSLYDKV